MRSLIRLARVALVLAAYNLASPAIAQQPNIVVILVDDAALMDFSSFGGEARTTNIDALTETGVAFSNYHTSPMCAPSRAMLLTGMDSHKTGIGALPEIMNDAQRASPAYSQRLLPGVITLAGILKTGGYQTFMAGKWHLGEGESDLPNSHGFDRSLALEASGADNYEDKHFMPFYDDAPWFEDGKPITLEGNFYSSELLVDRIVGYLQDRDQAKPFFAYLPFLAIHIPVQAPREYTDRYAGVYNAGWDVLRRTRFERAKDLGFIPVDAVAPMTPASLRKWDNLSAQDKAHYERRMMVNAGMLEAMDFHIGRLITYLESTGEFENTIFVVTSDNGPEFGEPNLSEDFQTWMGRNGYNDDFETLGERGSNIGIGAEWANAASGPSHLFKTFASEGGTRVPLIISGPGIPAQPFNGARSFVLDITPTLAELAGVPVNKVDGRSLVPILKGEADEVHGEEDAIGFEVAGNSALYKGRYKITRNTLPFGDAQWRLYDLSEDPTETQDLSEELPDLFAQMQADYAAYAERNGVIALPADFDVYEQLNINAEARVISRMMPYVIAGGGVIIILLVAGIVLFHRRRARRA